MQRRNTDPEARTLRPPRFRLDSAITAFGALEPRTRIGAVAGAVVLVAVTVFVIGNAALGTKPTQTAAPSAFVAPEPSATPIKVRATPPGTPAPRPTNFVLISASVPVPSSVPKPPRATASPEPALWRLEGYVLDDAMQPVENTCIVIGPVSCQPYSPHSDDRGHWFVDIAANTNLVNFDVYFEIPGHQTVWLRVVPTGSTTFNAVLKRT